jgi:hypothetical protein
MIRREVATAFLLCISACTYHPEAEGLQLGSATLSLSAQRVVLGTPIDMTVSARLTDSTPASDFTVTTYVDRCERHLDGHAQQFEHRRAHSESRTHLSGGERSG